MGYKASEEHFVDPCSKNHNIKCSIYTIIKSCNLAFTQITINGK